MTPIADLTLRAGYFLTGTLTIGGVVNAKTLQIFGRACFAANKLGGRDAKQSFTYAYVSYLIGAFGGGFICPILLGAPPKPLMNDKIIILSLLAFVLFTRTSFFKGLYNLFPVKILGLILENCFKAGLIAGFFGEAQAALGSLVGPVVVATIAGCGGVLVPFTGLGALAGGVPKPISLAFLGACFFAVFTDARYSVWLPVPLPLLSAAHATLVLIVVFSADAISDALRAMKKAFSASDVKKD